MYPHTAMYYAGYQYYVYAGPGMITYWRTLADAHDWAQAHGGTIGIVD